MAWFGLRQYYPREPGLALAGNAEPGQVLQLVDYRELTMRLCLLLLFVLSVLKLSAQSFSPFLYFQF